MKYFLSEPKESIQIKAQVVKELREELRSNFEKIELQGKGTKNCSPALFRLDLLFKVHRQYHSRF